MPFNSRAFVDSINALHYKTVVLWHALDSTSDYDGFLRTICKQHRYNFLLWHEEDRARNPKASDTHIAMVKRTIDRYNQQRNNWIEKIDQWLITTIAQEGVVPDAKARLNTETPGSVIDRLSIMSLRIYHFEEELQRTKLDPSPTEWVAKKVARCHQQYADLTQALGELLEDLFEGKKILRVYRQMKMYNDPTLNPVLYQASQRPCHATSAGVSITAKSSRTDATTSPIPGTFSP